MGQSAELPENGPLLQAASLVATLTHYPDSQIKGIKSNKILINSPFVDDLIGYDWLHLLAIP